MTYEQGILYSEERESFVVRARPWLDLCVWVPVRICIRCLSGENMLVVYM
jgi:hypothetical protein